MVRGEDGRRRWQNNRAAERHAGDRPVRSARPGLKRTRLASRWTHSRTSTPSPTSNVRQISRGRETGEETRRLVGPSLSRLRTQDILILIAMDVGPARLYANPRGPAEFSHAVRRWPGIVQMEPCKSKPMRLPLVPGLSMPDIWAVGLSKSCYLVTQASRQRDETPGRPAPCPCGSTRQSGPSIGGNSILVLAIGPLIRSSCQGIELSYGEHKSRFSS